jgi:hypothetical protein
MPHFPNLSPNVPLCVDARSMKPSLREWAGGTESLIPRGSGGECNPTRQHEGTVASHHRLRLYAKVTQHFFRAPASNEADDVGVNASTQEGHGTRCSQGPSVDVGPSEAVGGLKD